MFSHDVVITATLLASGFLFGFHATCITARDNFVSQLSIKFLPLILGTLNLTLGIIRLLALA